MNELSTWQIILEDEIAQAEALDKMLDATNLDIDTKEMVRKRTLLRLEQEIVSIY